MSIDRTFSMFLPGVVGLALSAGAFAQNIVVNGSFEAPNAGGSFTNRSGSFGAGNGWSIGANIDHIGGFWAAADGGQSVDMNGSTAGSVSQLLATTIGRVYRLRYAASENFFGFANKTMNVSWGGTVIENVVIPHDPTRTTTNVKWVYHTRNVVATSSQTALGFTSTTGAMNGSQGVAPFYGPAIDDVSVVEIARCAGDLNNDGVVDDSDFVVFVFGYNLLDCADPAMTAGCPADLNGDGVVDDGDFSIFVVAYDALLCP